MAFQHDFRQKRVRKAVKATIRERPLKMPFCFTTTLLIFLSMTIINLLILETIVKSSNLGTFEVQIETNITFREVTRYFTKLKS